MIISHKYKFIFFRPNGKCGTTSIENALREYHEGSKEYLESGGKTNLTHMPPRYLFLNPENRKFMNYFMFAVVRNPYDWYLSLHRHSIKDNVSDSNVYVPRAYKCDSPKGSFDLKRIKEVLTVIHMADYVWENQFCGLCYRGNCMMNATIHFEDLQNAFDKVMDFLELPRKKLGHFRKKKDHEKWKPYQYYYSKEGMEAVETVCDFDFHQFGYKRESKNG